VQRIWKAHGLKPHLVRTFKASNDPDFAKKVEDIVGLYLDPPDKALVLAVDEKSQIQALDRTQPGLPLKKGRAGTMTHDYKRHGTTTLFAALDVATGQVIGECLPRHRAKEFLKFLRRIDKETLPCLDLHLILDNYATHKTPAVQRWLKCHPRFKLHFTPASSSWLNLVERLFAERTCLAMIAPYPLPLHPSLVSAFVFDRNACAAPGWRGQIRDSPMPESPASMLARPASVNRTSQRDVCHGEPVESARGAGDTGGRCGD
jgi:hypothetical protein